MPSIKTENGKSTNQDFIRKCSKPLKITRTCPGCQEHCKSKLDVYKHLAKCRADAFLCPVQGCPFASLHKQHYEYHLKMHSGEKEIECPRCPYTCSTNTMLKSHMRTHEEIMRFRCSNCNMVSKHPSQLSQHLASTGHTAAPVLNEDGTVPDDESQRDFRNHIRPKKRMLGAVDVPLKTTSKKAKMNRTKPARRMKYGIGAGKDQLPEPKKSSVSPEIKLFPRKPQNLRNSSFDIPLNSSSTVSTSDCSSESCDAEFPARRIGFPNIGRSPAELLPPPTHFESQTIFKSEVFHQVEELPRCFISCLCVTLKPLMDIPDADVTNLIPLD